MNYKVFFLSVFLLAHHFGAISQNRMEGEEVLALVKIENPSFTIHFEYNQSGWVTSETKISLKYDDLSYKFEYEYDEYSNITLLKKYDKNFEVWKFTHYEENEYNDNNQMVTKKIYTDYGAGFRWIEQQLYTYQDTFLETTICQNITPSGDVFNNTKRVYFYNKESQLFQIKEYAWISSDWMHIETFDLEYDDFNNMLSYSNEVLAGEEFNKNWRYLFTYNNDNEITERAFYYGALSEWGTRPSNKYIYYFEEEEETILFPNIYKFDVINFNWFQPGKKLIQDDYWSADCSGVLHFVESANYLYRGLTIGVGVKDYEKEQVLVYPNPTTGIVEIAGQARNDVRNIEIFDVYGKTLSSNHLITSSSNHFINISHLPPGIYFIKITTQTTTKTQKIIKL